MQRGVDRPNGVKDFDVWSFFAAIPGEQFPAAIRHRHCDFGPSKFGAADGPVDIAVLRQDFGRSLPYTIGQP